MIYRFITPIYIDVVLYRYINVVIYRFITPIYIDVVLYRYINVVIYRLHQTSVKSDAVCHYMECILLISKERHHGNLFLQML